jgi:hypothetical protein
LPVVVEQQPVVHTQAPAQSGNQPPKNYAATQNDTHIKQVETRTDATSSSPSQQNANVTNQPTEGNTEKGPRKPRRFHPRHRHSKNRGNKSEHTDQNRHAFDGEDRYSSQKKDGDE